MRIRLLGTGTPTPSLKRMCSGYVVELGADEVAAFIRKEIEKYARVVKASGARVE
jgi:hypothetical protein